MNRPHISFRRLPILSFRRFMSVTVLFSMLSMLFLAGTAAAAPATAALQLEAKAAFLMDAETGQVLYQHNPDEPLPPASMAKMMTEYLVMKAVSAGTLKWDQAINVGDNAAAQTGSRIFLAKGDTHTVEELYIAMAVGSANDATVQLAETIAGSEEEFAKLMNETAAKLGMKHSHFINSTGLDRADMPEQYRPSSIEGETVMSALDAAILGRAIVMEEPDFLKYSSILKHKFRERDQKPMDNWNWMLAANKDNPNLRKFAYEGVDGLKTGHTSRAGNCFTGTALRNGTRLISVVMKVPGTTNEGRRFLETAKLFDYGFNNFEKKTIVEAKAPVKDHETLNVKKGKQKSVPVITASDVTILVPKGSTVEMTETTVQSAADPLKAPLKEGEKVGTVTYKYTDPSTGEVKSAVVDLVAKEDVNKASWWRLLFRAIGDFFSGLFKGIVNLF